MDLFDHTRALSFGGKRYAYVIVDDFSKFTCILFLANKHDAFHEFQKFCKKIQNEKDLKFVKIRNDHGGKFENEYFENFCEEHHFEHDFSFLRALYKME